MSWKPLTLSEAHGFITSYIIEYYPSLNNKKRQAPSDIMRVNVSADLSSVTIDGLDENLIYTVQVSAGTSAGGGVVSSPQVAEIFIFPRDNTGAIVGGVVAVVLIVTVAVTIIAISAMILRSKEDSKPTHMK